MDLWDPSSINLLHNMIYIFFLFVDDGTRFQYIYMLSNKSQATIIFLHFEAIISRYFGVPIKQQQIDGGIELKSLETHLFQGGYVRSIYCPHTPLQNGVVERKNRYVVEIGLTMLMKSGVSMSY